MNEFDKIRRKLSELSDLVDSVEKSLTNDGDTHIEIDVPPVDKPWFADLPMNEFGGVKLPYVEDVVRPQMLRSPSLAIRNLAHKLPRYWIFNGMSDHSNHQIAWNSAAFRIVASFAHKDHNFFPFDYFYRDSELQGLAPSEKTENTDTFFLIERDHDYDINKTYSQNQVENLIAEFINMKTDRMPFRKNIDYGDYSPSLTN